MRNWQEILRDRCVTVCVICVYVCVFRVPCVQVLWFRVLVSVLVVELAFWGDERDR